VLKNKRVRTNRVATDLCLKVSNASTQLKELWEMGYLLRTEEVADSGGVEFVYCATI
jgi:predicted transcriptional regulator